MLAWRSAFIAGGTFFGVSLAPYLVGSLGGGAAAYQQLGLAMAVTVAVASWPASGSPASPTRSHAATNVCRCARN